MFHSLYNCLKFLNFLIFVISFNCLILIDSSRLDHFIFKLIKALCHVFESPLMGNQSLLSQGLLMSCLSIKRFISNNYLIINFIMDFNVWVWIDSSWCWRFWSHWLSICSFIFDLLLVFESMAIPSCLLLFLIQWCSFLITSLSIVWPWLVQSYTVLSISLSEVIRSISLTRNTMFAISYWVWCLLGMISKSVIFPIVSIKVTWNEWICNRYFKTIQIILASLTHLWFLSCVWPLILSKSLIFRIHLVLNTKLIFACSFGVNGVELFISLW